MPPLKTPGSTEYTIGSIVALSTHPFFQISDKDEILISGDALSLSPIMIVIETLKENRSLHDENSGIEIVSKDTWQCKCLWYSHKSGLYEDVWVSSRLLKKISVKEEKLESKDLKFGSAVILKTNSIELGKKKVSLKTTNEFSDGKNKTLTGLLPFVSPVMQVIGTAKSDSKEPFLDPKTGKVRREISAQLIKCKYYNQVSEKFSETLIPIETLEKVIHTTDEYLSTIKAAIKNNILFKISSANAIFKTTVIKPLKIIYKSGNYYLEGEDYLENKFVEILLMNEKFEAIDYQFDHLPEFKVNGENLTLDLITKQNLELFNRGYYWRIKYKDYTEKITTRTIYNPSFFISDYGEEKNVNYLKANCILRSGLERYFRIDRIQKITVIDILSINNQA